jgi:predicted methyltransferase
MKIKTKAKLTCPKCEGKELTIDEKKLIKKIFTLQ